MLTDNMDEKEINQILIKLDYKAKRRAIENLKKEHKNNPKILKILENLEKKLPANI